MTYAARRNLTLIVLTALCVACTSAPVSTGEYRALVTLEQEAASAYAEGNLRRAEEAYGELTQRVPQDAEYWYRLGNVRVRASEPDRAVEAYLSALERDPSHTRAWHNLGVIRLRQAHAAMNQSAQSARPGDPVRDASRELARDIARLTSGELSTPSGEAESANEENTQ